MTINNKSERNYRGKCLDWPVTSYGGAQHPWMAIGAAGQHGGLGAKHAITEQE